MTKSKQERERERENKHKQFRRVELLPRVYFRRWSYRTCPSFTRTTNPNDAVLHSTSFLLRSVWNVYRCRSFKQRHSTGSRGRARHGRLLPADRRSATATPGALEQHAVERRKESKSPASRSRHRAAVVASRCHVGRRRLTGNDVILARWRHADADTAATPWCHCALTLQQPTAPISLHRIHGVSKTRLGNSTVV